MPKWSIVTLERACRRAFVERGSMELAVLNDAAAKAWVLGGHISATIDPMTTSYLGGMLHELCHMVLRKETEDFKAYTTRGGIVTDDLQEIAINGYEKAVYDLIYKDPKRLAWWRRAIDKKLRQAKP